MPGILLDTHTLYWFVSGEEDLTDEALVAIGGSQQAGTLFVSPVTAWELSVATQKPRAPRRPHLGAVSPEDWFREAIRATAAKLVPIHQRISCEAASAVTGNSICHSEACCDHKDARCNQRSHGGSMGKTRPVIVEHRVSPTDPSCNGRFVQEHSNCWVDGANRHRRADDRHLAAG